MQFVRLIKQDNTEELYSDLRICLDFQKSLVKIWNGAYWEETPFNNYKIIACFDAEENYTE